MDKKLGRNDPCACGSGKKYKQCCMQKTASAAKYTPSGQRKFKATLLSSSQPLFSRLASPATEASASATMEQLRFRMTQQDFRKKVEDKPIRFSLSEETPHEQAPPTLPPEGFSPTSEDFREKK